jgi:hypothetical protein
MWSILRHLRRSRTILVLSSPLVPEEVRMRLQRYVEPPGISLSRLLPSPYLFVGEIQEYQFSMLEISSLGKRGSGAEILGTIMPMEKGSEITITIQALEAEYLLSLFFLLVLVSGFSWFVYLISIGVVPISCLFFPVFLGGVVAIVLRSFTRTPAPAYANLEAHFRMIFAAVDPTQRFEL